MKLATAQRFHICGQLGELIATGEKRLMSTVSAAKGKTEIKEQPVVARSALCYYHRKKEEGLIG